nr:MAG: capsid protein [Chemarfal virus 185]
MRDVAMRSRSRGRSMARIPAALRSRSRISGFLDRTLGVASYAPGAIGAAARAVSIGRQTVRAINAVQKAVRGTDSVQKSSETLKAMVTHNELVSTGWTKKMHEPIGKYMRDMGTIDYSQYCQSVLQWDQGRQGVQDMFQAMNLAQFHDSATSSPDPRLKWPNNIFGFDVDQNTSGSGVIIAGTTSRTNIMYLKTAKFTTELVNLTNNAQIGQIYWFMSKGACVRTPLQEWEFQNKQEKLGQDVANQDTPLSGQPQYYFPGKSPLTIGGFNRTYKLLHTDKFTLQSGGHLKIYSKLYVNKLIKQTKVEELMQNVAGTGDLAVPPLGYPGVTIFPLLIVRSASVLNSELDVMTYGGGKIGWTCTQAYTFVPGTMDEKFPYERIYPSIKNQSWTPSNETMILDTDVAGTVERAT